MKREIEALLRQGKGVFACPSCGAPASDANPPPYCSNGCTEARMIAAIESAPPRCLNLEREGRWSHDVRQCLACRVREAWVRDEAERLRRERHLDRLRRSVREGTAVEEGRRRFPLYSAAEVSARKVPPDSLPGILGPPGTVSEVTGYRGSGKSLFVHGIAQAVSLEDKEVYDLRLRLGGPVLYVAREGVPGWPKRLRAWEAYHGRKAGEVTFLHDALDITDPADVAALSAILKDLGAVLLVLDPVSMTGGGIEDAENYQEYRTAALELAIRREMVVALVTNTGHAIRSRGRGSSTLVDGMDASITLSKDDQTRMVTLTSGKERDMADLLGVHVRFEGAGEKDPDDDSRYLSGVMVRVPEGDVLAEKLARDLKAANRALHGAEAALVDCSCRQGSTEPPEGCEGATNERMAEALGVDLGRRRSREVSDALRPIIANGVVRSVGKTQAFRWHWGRAQE